MVNIRWRRVDKLKGITRDNIIYLLAGLDLSEHTPRKVKKPLTTAQEQVLKEFRKLIYKKPLLAGVGTYEEKKRLKVNQLAVRTMTTAKPLKQGMHHKKKGRKL